MSAEAMMDFLDASSPEARLGFQAAVHCGPVLKGIKISNVMTAERGTWRMLEKALRGSGVLCVLLAVHKDREVLLLYRYDRLQSHLEDGKVREFLRGCGYEDMSVAAVIIRLRSRYAGFALYGRGFPHELGVILEYPVEDVKGFIENGGKNCLMEKYWKVYHDRERAAMLFNRYDQAREEAVEEAIAGYPLCRIAVREEWGEEIMGGEKGLRDEERRLK